MPVNSRINKAGLSTVQKNQLRRALNEKVAIQVVASDITSAASTNTTLVDVRASGTGTSYLVFPVKAYKTYVVSAALDATCTTNNGVKLGFTGPTAGIIRGRIMDDGTYALYDAFTDVATEAAAAGTALSATFQFAYRPTADGYLKAQWAEATNHADTITLKAGSFVKVEEVA